ncbi:hypothetical protein [Spongorhabdus nitratireducens]
MGIRGPVDTQSAPGVDFNSVDTKAFEPLDERVSGDGARKLRQAGFSRENIKTIRRMADAAQRAQIQKQELDDLEEVILGKVPNLNKLQGIEKETVKILGPFFLLRAGGNPGNWDGVNYKGPAPDLMDKVRNGDDVDLDNVDLQSLMMAVMVKRSSLLQNQLEGSIKGVQAKNATLDKANQMLARAREKKNQAGSGSSKMDQDMVDFWKMMGAKTDGSGGDNKHNSAQWDVNIEGLKGKIESLSSSSQLDLTRLQSTMNKYNQAFEQVSNFTQKYFQSLNTLTANLK